MTRAVIAVVAIVVIASVSYWMLSSSGPVKTYEAFAEAVLQRDYDKASHMTVGLTPADLERLGSQERIGAGPPMFQKLFPSRFKIESEKKNPDGSVTLVSVQTVLFNPAGVESALRPAMYAELRQTTDLQKTSDGWKIASFRNEFVRMDEPARR